ncbi:alanine racemase [Neisseria sp. Ec49-e6-T10]|uniref:alanine racemase n=1 Tax=Neisseria sp. Ec49-e6-T10 TaxID=3140744 RepID=UPI003EBE635A
MRPLTAQINLTHLKHNYQLLKQLHGSRLLAVLKANAYGHGAVQCAKALADMADGFAVACIEEAIELRMSGINNPIVLLEGVFEPQEYALIDQYTLWPVIQSQYQLDHFLAYDWQEPVHVWLKMDSGMSRAGFFPQDYADAYTQLKQSPHVQQITKMTHFARADEPELSMTDEQIERFDQVCQHLEGDESLANSAAILSCQKAHRQWGRGGLALYGLSPLISGGNFGLKPVMSLSTKVFGVRELKAGVPIGYGATYVTEQNTKVGLIACGYADGYPRLASTDSPVLIDGQLSRIIGRVSMDMITVELTHIQGAGIGSHVELWGEQLSIHDIAKQAGTLAYELLCHVKRAKFIYLD